MSDIQIFRNENFGEVRVTEVSGEPMFCLADVCKALELSNVSQVKSRLKEDGVIANEVIDNLGRKQQATFINEANLYKCIFQSRTENAEQFQDWVYEEVLPSIRKHGGYMVAKMDETAEELMSRALLVANETLKRRDKRIAALEMANTEQRALIIAQGEQIKERDTAIEQMLPKVSYYEQILQSNSTVLTTQIAADYGMSARKFNVLLRNLEIQRKVGGQWILYKPYASKGYTHSDTFIPEHSKTGRVRMLTKWTQHGRLFLYDTLKKRGVLPLIEQN